MHEHNKEDCVGGRVLGSWLLGYGRAEAEGKDRKITTQPCDLP